MPNPTDGFAPNLGVPGSSRVFVEILGIVENLDYVDEIQLMIGEICLTLDRIPVELEIDPHP